MPVTSGCAQVGRDPVKPSDTTGAEWEALMPAQGIGWGADRKGGIARPVTTRRDMRDSVLELTMASIDPTPADLDHNYAEANRILVAFTKRGEYRERNGVAIVASGLPVEALNWGLLRAPFDDVAETAAAVRACFAPGLPYRLVFRAESLPALRVLESAGWCHRSEPTPAMTLTLPASIPPSPRDLAIDEVRSAAVLGAYGEAAFLGFGYPVRAAGLFLHERLLEFSHVRLYAGVVDGVVVATSMLVVTGAVAGIYWVATREEQRRRGYGEALTWAAVAGGRAFGCRVAFLQASKVGLPVYARMGFAHAFDYEHLHPTP